MGIYRNSSNILCFEPDNDARTLWIDMSCQDISMEDLLDAIRKHFGEDTGLGGLSITAQHIHTYAIGYDRYDSGDWDDYLKITKD